MGEAKRRYRSGDDQRSKLGLRAEEEAFREACAAHPIEYSPRVQSFIEGCGGYDSFSAHEREEVDLYLCLNPPQFNVR